MDLKSRGFSLEFRATLKDLIDCPRHKGCAMYPGMPSAGVTVIVQAFVYSLGDLEKVTSGLVGFCRT